MSRKFEAPFLVQFEISELERDLIKNNPALIREVAKDAAGAAVPFLEDKLKEFFKGWDEGEPKQVEQEQAPTFVFTDDGTLAAA